MMRMKRRVRLGASHVGEDGKGFSITSLYRIYTKEKKSNLDFLGIQRTMMMLMNYKR
jgi:hypothetical protein